MTDPSSTVTLQDLTDLLDENHRLRQRIEQQERVIYTLHRAHERPAPPVQWAGGTALATHAIATGQVREFQVQRVMTDEEFDAMRDGAASIKEQALCTLMRAVQARVHYEMLPDSRTRTRTGLATILIASVDQP